MDEDVDEDVDDMEHARRDVMTTEETPATNLDLHLRRVDGTWTLQCKTLGHEVKRATLDEAARVMHAMATDEATTLAAAAQTGYLMAEGCKRLARLQALVAVLSPLAVPGK